MTHEERLREYVEKDKIYQEYKNKKPPTDFDRFCFVHCEDIEWALGEIKHLRELQKSMDKQYEELEQENKQLKLTNQALSGCLKIDKEKIDYYVDRCEQLEKVLDEIREYIEEFVVYSDEDGEIYFKEEFWNEYNNLLQILDKVKE